MPHDTQAHRRIADLVARVVALEADVAAASGAALDAFGRARSSLPYTLFDSKQIHDNQPQFWDDSEVSGSGTSSSHSVDEAATTIGVSATTAGKRVRQTFMRFNYQPGKSQQILMTGILTASGAGTGNTFEIGQRDDNNGVFWRHKDGVAYVVNRSKATGSAVDAAVAQSAWNLDPMDGTGDSGITLDFAKTLIFALDYEWLGVGRVRMGFVVAGTLTYCHEFLNSNVQTAVYMSTPNLPLRYSIENDGTGGAATLMHICSTVISEGGVQDLGTKHSNSVSDNAATSTAKVNANTAGTAYALCGLRLKAATLGGTVTPIELSVMSDTSDDYEWGLSINPTLAAGLTWTDETNSVVQFGIANTAGNPSTTTLSALGTVVDGGFVKSGVSTGDLSAVVASARRLGADIAGTVDAMILWVRPLGSNADMRGGLTWRELS